MTYANEYRLGRRAYHFNQEESLALVLSVVAVVVLAAGYYILATRFHIRPAQLIELSLYALYGLSLCRFTHLVFRHFAPKTRRQTGPILLYLSAMPKIERRSRRRTTRTRSCSATTSTASHGSGRMQRA